MMKLSVVIPVHNEQAGIKPVALAVAETLAREAVPYEILIVNDNSTDQTEAVLKELARDNANIRYVNNHPPNGFGLAVRYGLRHFTGDAAAVYMGDGSDSPADLVQFYRKVQEGYDCVFGTRWSQGGQVYDYPFFKRIFNRLANNFIRVIMQIGYDDVTNAFKMYRREVIHGVRPLLSRHYNLTVEMAIIRGYSYTVVPNSWTMGSRYLFIVLYCLLEKWLSHGDYHRSQRT